MSDVIVGIDLGTTNSEVAMVKDGQVTVIPIAAGGRILPSCVGLGDDGQLLVGEPAKNQYVLYPERTVRSVKRHMGSDERFVLGEQAYSPQEISALILKRLKAIAEEHLQLAVTKAVITVPAYFSDAQRQATREAGELAGLEVVRIINEPTAAALAYKADQSQRKRVLVYDLGGGTFDVSVVAIEEDVVEVLASHGDNHLGGDDFDHLVVEHLVEHLQQTAGVDPTTSRRAMARIQRAAETAKIALSDQPFVLVEEEYLLEDEAGNPVNLSLEIQRDDYEALIAPLIERTLEALHIALKGAHLALADVDEVLLVGGATRTPLIQTQLRDELGLTVHAEIDPDLCVATGAAVQAAIYAGQPIATVLVDVTPYTFGISALGERNGAWYPYVYVPLIHKNTSIPVAKGELFQTSHDDQVRVDINVYQGEDPDALNNIEIGKFTVENLSAVPAGNPIVVNFALDLNGILQVTAIEKETGLQKSVTITNAMGRVEGEAMASAKRRLAQLFPGEEKVATDAGPRGDRALRDRAHSRLERATALLDQVEGDDREDLISAMEALRDALEQDGDIGTAQGDLDDMLFYLEP